mmetsp:Transcript_18158/g.21350  ORF Transcript_18158/g.21350 Transcript_18158/m.21350 type:complete len:104 (+) Transcript_18158:2775-3086(+)
MILSFYPLSEEARVAFGQHCFFWSFHNQTTIAILNIFLHLLFPRGFRVRLRSCSHFFKVDVEFAILSLRILEELLAVWRAGIAASISTCFRNLVELFGSDEGD